jgi:hypothetical protein
MRRPSLRVNQRRESLGPAPLAPMAPVTPRFGERPTVASVVRRHLQRARAAAAVRGRPGRTSAAVLPCGHPADQPHDRFHAFQPVQPGAFGRGTLARGI